MCESPFSTFQCVTLSGCVGICSLRTKEAIGSLELVLGMALFTPAKRLGALLICVLMGFECRIHMNVGWSPVSPIVVGAMALTVVLMGKGPKKKVWLSSEAVESKKND
eukprot:298589_1